MERPILFSGRLVRAILAGAKTQTRRPLKSASPLTIEKIRGQTHGPIDASDGRPVNVWHVRSGPDNLRNVEMTACPFGAAGDRLYVRETWAPGYLDGRPYRMPASHKPRPGDPILYAATHDVRCNDNDAWRPSIHMPRWASRIDLDVLGVRVERLQEISEEDARAEGVDGYVYGHGPVSASELAAEPGFWHPRFYRAGFEDAWDSIYGTDPAKSWAANPFVWIVSFASPALASGGGS